jgi:hypothetical protein
MKSPAKTQNFSLILSEHVIVKGTLFYIVSRRNSSSKFKGTEKLWKCEIFPCQDSPKWTLDNSIAVFMKQTQHPAMGCELSLLVSCMFHSHWSCWRQGSLLITTGHAGGRVHCSCGCWSEIHMLTIESVTVTPTKLERHAIQIFRQW